MSLYDSFFDELTKVAESHKKKKEEAQTVGASTLVGSGLGRTISDLSLATKNGPSPRRRTIGTLVGALSGLGYAIHRIKKKEKQKTASPFTFKGTITKSFLSKPGKSILSQTPKIGRKGIF